MCFPFLLVKRNCSIFQLNSNPSDIDENEAQSRLMKSDEIQRWVTQSRANFDRKDYITAVAHLDLIIEVSGTPDSTPNVRDKARLANAL